MLRARALLVVAITVGLTFAGSAANAHAVLGGTVPPQQAVTFAMPETEFASGSLNVDLGTYPTTANFQASLLFTASLAVYSQIGEEHVDCDITAGGGASPPVIGSTQQANTGALEGLYGRVATIAIAANYTAGPGQSLTLVCKSTGLFGTIGAYMFDGQTVIEKTTSQLSGGTAALPGAQTRQLDIPTSHVADATPLNVDLGTYGSSATKFPTWASFTASVAPRSLTGEEHVTCALTIGSPARTIGVATQAGTGANLPSTAYRESTIAITGTYTAAPGEPLDLACSTTGASDALLIDGQVDLLSVPTQATRNAGPSATVPDQSAVSFHVPKEHVAPDAFRLALATYPADATAQPTVAAFTSSVAYRSPGTVDLKCELDLETAAGNTFVIDGSFDEASGAALPSTAYPTESIAMTGTFTPIASASVDLSCTSTGASDAIVLNGTLVLHSVKSQKGGPRAH